MSLVKGDIKYPLLIRSTYSSTGLAGSHFGLLHGLLRGLLCKLGDWLFLGEIRKTAWLAATAAMTARTRPQAPKASQETLTLKS